MHLTYILAKVEKSRHYQGYFIATIHGSLYDILKIQLLVMLKIFIIMNNYYALEYISVYLMVSY